MRMDVKKYLFIGASAKKEAFLSACQHAGIIHFLGTTTAPRELLIGEFQEVVQAIKFLKQFDVEQTIDVVVADPLSFSQRILADKQRIEDLHARAKTLRAQLSLVAPFGKIPYELMQEIEATGHVRFRLFFASKKRKASEKFPQLIEVGSFGNLSYFISLTTEPFSPSGVEEIPLTRELSSLLEEIQKNEKEVSELISSLHLRAALVESTKRALVDSVNNATKQHVTENTSILLEDHLFFIAGWAPASRQDEMENIARSLDVFIEEMLPASDEIPPTCLENKNLSKIGEDLINIYDVPSHTDNDPSLWVLVSFALFFAMIIGDAGYGLVFLATALLCRKKATSPAARRGIKLLGILGISSFLWGCCIHSFFDIELSPHNLLRHHSPLSTLVESQAQYRFLAHDEMVAAWTQDHAGIEPSSWQQFLYEPASPSTSTLYAKFADSTLLEIALLIGTIHILLSILRYLPRDYSSIGWVFFIIGGYLYLIQYLGAVSILNHYFGLDPTLGFSIGGQLAGSGLALAVVGSIIRYGITGIFELMKSVQILSDILSYLRLYALGVAGGMIGSLANSCAEKLPFIFAVIVIISTHVINIVMSIMSGVIHGLRLNFLEWYHYSFEGGGKRFYPLKLETYR